MKATVLTMTVETRNSDDWNRDTDGFVRALRNDNYAEYELCDGHTLVTDWEGDGGFYPYIVPNDAVLRRNQYDDTETKQQLSDAMCDAFPSITVYGIEWSPHNHAWFPAVDAYPLAQRNE